MDTDDRSILLVCLGFVTGLILGVGTGILLAPQSGYRTRRQIKNIVEDATERAGEMAEDAKETVGEFIAKGKNFVK